MAEYRESICRSCFHAYVCEQFNEHRDVHNTKCHFFNDHFVASADVAPVVHGRWISVEEGLPDNEDVVLCVTKNKRPFVCRYDHYWKHWRVSGSVKVTHWMPLPEPPHCGARMDGE